MSDGTQQSYSDGDSSDGCIQFPTRWDESEYSASTSNTVGISILTGS